MQLAHAINLKVIQVILILLSLIASALIIFGMPLISRPITASGELLVTNAFDYAKAVLLCFSLAAAVGLLCYRQNPDGEFLLALFVGALMTRILVGSVIYAYNGQAFFGGDALTYDHYGYIQLKAWAGEKYYESVANAYVGHGANPGWGMVYIVAAIYGVLGRNLFAVQLVNSIMGAATAPLIFLCSYKLFQNLRVARFAALAVAFYPSLVLWSSQGLKDGPIVFCLALSILATLKLGEKFSVKYLLILVCSLFAILSLRFYIFYMLTVAIGSSFLIGLRPITPVSFVRQAVVIMVVGLVLTYLGVTRVASLQFERYGRLSEVQRSRLDLATSANSGFEKDVDVSTTQGALRVIPKGLIYLLFAPFPWQVGSLRQNITLPEMVIWWACFPLLVLGGWFSLKYRLRQIFPVATFTVMLSIAYSMFQGNVGTAYRQRAQLLVFYFIFVAVGYVLLLERREEKKQLGSQESIPPRVAPVSPLRPTKS